jgi:hypothetical protein
MTLDDVSKASKLLITQVSEDRLSAVLPFLDQAMQVFREGIPTVQLAKEVEPATFVSLIRKAAAP